MKIILEKEEILGVIEAVFSDKLGNTPGDGKLYLVIDGKRANEIEDLAFECEIDLDEL